jgi:hypothetical protein
VAETNAVASTLLAVMLNKFMTTIVLFTTFTATLAAGAFF